MKIFEKYIFRELIYHFIFYTFIFNALFVTLKLIDFIPKIIEGNLTLYSAIKLSLLLIPSFGIFTIPLITLSSTLFTFSKLSSNNEITALKTLGISPFGLIKIPILIGSFAFLFGVLNNFYILPFSTKLFLNEVNNIIKSQTENSLKPQTFNDLFSKTVFFFKNKDEHGYMNQLLIYNNINNQNEIIEAEKGVIDIDKNTIFLKLVKGNIHIKKKLGQYEIINFNKYILKYNIEESIKASINLKDKESSVKEIKNRIKKYRKIKAWKKVNYLKMEIYKRYSLPFASIIFVIIGFIFGIKSNRNPTSWTALIILGVIFSYYFLVMLSNYFAKSGILAPAISAWLPNMVIGTFSMILYYFISKEKIRL